MANMGEVQAANFVPAGEWLLAVVNFKVFKFNSGSKGVEFQCQDAQKRETKGSFTFENPDGSDNEQALKRLAYFLVNGLGMSIEDRKKINTKDDASWAICTKRKFIGTVKKKQSNTDRSKFFNELVDWRKAEGGKAPAGEFTGNEQYQMQGGAKPGSRPAAQQQSSGGYSDAADSSNVQDGEDDLPF